MGQKRYVYAKDTYKGVVIMDQKRKKKGKVTGFYKSMLDGLFKLGYYARDGSGYQRPIGLMLSFAFTEDSFDYPISKVMTKIWNAFSKSRLPKFDNDGKRLRHGREPESTFKPEYMWCREIKYLDQKSPEFNKSLSKVEQEYYTSAELDGCPIPYVHFHVLIALDDKFGSWASIKTVMDRLVKAGIVRAGFHFSENNKTKEKVLKLDNEKEFQEYIYRGAYICKTVTKEVTDTKFWSMSSCKKRVSKRTRKK